MGDQQLSPSSIDLGRSVSIYSAEQQPTTDAEDGDEGRRLPVAASASAARSSPPLAPEAPAAAAAGSSSSPSSSAVSGQSPVVPAGVYGLGQQLDEQQQQQSSSSSSSLSSSLTLVSAATTSATVDEANVNSVVLSLGLMQVGADASCQGSAPTVDGLQQLSSNSNHQNLYPAIYQLLAQSQLPVQKWPATGIKQQNAVSSFCPATAQNSMLFGNLQPGHGWNSSGQTNLLSHSNDFSSPWGQNQQSRNANGLPSNTADAKLQLKSSFAKNFPHSFPLRTGKTASEESADGIQLSHDSDILKLSGVNASVLEMSGFSHSQNHLKGFPNWALASQQTTKRGMSPYGLPDHFQVLENGSFDQVVPNLAQLSGASPNSLSPFLMEHYSRKVFVGGLPPDIDEEEITTAFRRFGPLIVDWPHKAESKSYFPPKGYCFLLFQDELSVQTLIDSCVNEDSKLFWFVSSPTMKDKMVQIRPWNLADSDFVMDGSQPLDPRKTIFVGGVPRPLRAVELAVIMERLYGGVCYAGIDTDPDLKYPKGAGRVAFSSQQSYIAAISARFVQLQRGEIDKRVEVKPYVLDDQLCDECQGIHCGGRFAPFFCANVTCLQYYCEHCWSRIHSRPGREFHKPLVKEGADRPRSLPFRWC